MVEYPHIPYRPARLSVDESRRRGREFLDELDARRSCRFFSDAPVPKELIEIAIRAASTAPSGAHRQPWTFVAISDPQIKREIRIAAEEEERKSYDGRMPDEWIAALRPLGTDWPKPYLETVPWIVVCFAQNYGVDEHGERIKNYYVSESVGIACGMFIACVHRMGLATLTHTPSPMAFLSKILGRPQNERAFILFPVGYPTADATVPDIQRKTLDQVAVFKE